MMYTYVIVDDEPLIRKGTIKKLEPIQDKISCIGEANNGAEAMELIEKLNPDIIITDMNMPVLDGTQLLPMLTKRYPDKRIVVISGYKDFEYMKHAITAKAVDYILKPFSRDDVQKSVLNAIGQIEKNQNMKDLLITSEEKKEAARYEYDIQMLKNLILGYHTSEVMINSKNLNFINRTHDLILVTLHCNQPLEESILHDFLEENSFGDLALFLQHLHQKNLGFLVLFIPEHAALGHKELCLQIVRGLDHLFFDLNYKVSYGISRPRHSLLELHGAFIETVGALNSRLLKDTATCFFYQDTQRESLTIVWDKTDEFLFRIEAGMKEKAMELLNNLFYCLSQNKNCTMYDAKVYCFWLSDQTKYMMSEYFDQSVTNSANSSMQNILNSMFSLGELEDYYQQFYSNIADILKESSIYAIDDTIEKMKLYIQRHYQNNLTIEFLSSLFYMNRSYCSHLFKEKTGDTFVNYLNGIRLQKAKQLLANTDKKMYQIAKSVGYDNVKYFFRVFKKNEHLTPEQFRIQKC